MNILHIIFSFNNGGSENLVVDLLNSWKNKKDNLFLCVVNDFYDEKLLNKIKNRNVKIVKLNRKVGGKKTAGMKKLRNIVKKEKIDVVHCHSVNVLNYAFLALGYSFKRKYIVTIHNVSIYGILSHKSVLMHKLFLHKITAISEAVKDSIVANGFPDKKIDIIYNGIDLEKYKNEHVAHDKITLLCVGRMVPSIKGQDILIKSLKNIIRNHSNIQCVFAGGNPENKDYISEMKELALQLGVEDYVVFLGDCHNVPEQMAKADILIVPSREEGFGLVVVEGMAAKIPVIATKTGGPTEIIDDFKTGYLVECDNPEELADRICQVISSDQQKLVEEAFEMVNKRFDIVNTIQAMRESYT